ncbi:DUF3800 domain-containing protein [Mycoplasma sp. P36-A1]|uniref:DUF3800 domain-containing protein n=1 Tax=Mycoplasma sp. P36-A1 TaxID=3252900 RepID=UPI003C30E76D
MPEKIQNILFYMDESGLINKNEPCSIYGGVWFTDKKKKEIFLRRYKSIIKNIKCKYCKDEQGKCNLSNCPEVKNTIIKNTDRRRIFTLIKKDCNTYSVIINNSKLYSSVLCAKEARGRYKDYIIKRIIKDVIKHELNNNYINGQKHINICIDLDQSSTVSNGYYGLKDGIIEELVYGIQNFDYGITFPPILKSAECKIHYCDSKNHSLIQASDILVGEVRKMYIRRDIKSINKLLNVKLYQP